MTNRLTPTASAPAITAGRGRAIAVEALSWIVGVAALAWLLRTPLFSGSTTLWHDNILWDFPAFRFFADHVAAGQLPYWNPYSHGGEPFFPLPAHLRLLDPVALLTTSAGSLVTRDTLLLFHWTRLAQSLVVAAGMYLTLRRFSRHWLSRLALVPILLLSSVTLGSFQQDGRLELALWVPFMAYFFLKIACFGEGGWPSWLTLSAVAGLNWLTYFCVPAWLFLGLLGLGLALFRSDLLARAARPGWRRKAAAFAGAQLLMLLPALAVVRLGGELVSPSRMADASLLDGPALGGPSASEPRREGASRLLLNYDTVTRMGTFSTPFDFMSLVRPSGSSVSEWPSWGHDSSEAFMYLGLPTWALALLGLLLGKDDLKRVWAFAGAAVGLLMLGPSGGVYPLLFFLFPPMRLVRHTHVFAGLFEFCLLYFFVLGLDLALDQLHERAGA